MYTCTNVGSVIKSSFELLPYYEKRKSDSINLEFFDENIGLVLTLLFCLSLVLKAEFIGIS
jgi:hypothetical protein